MCVYHSYTPSSTCCFSVQLVWIETPTNPMMKVVDIKACSEVAHEYNKDIVVVVDNTFMSAYFQVRVTNGEALLILKEWLIVYCHRIPVHVELSR